MVNCKTSANKNGQDLVNAMKAGKLKFGTTNAGGIDHITAYVFADKGGLMQPDIVPFSGGGEVATQLVAGALSMSACSIFPKRRHRSKRAISVPLIVLGTKRMTPIPDAVTAQELGIDAVFSTVRGFVTHAGVSAMIRTRFLRKSLVKAMNHAVYQGYLTTVGLDASSVAGADEWGAQIQKMIDDMIPAIKAMGL